MFPSSTSAADGRSRSEADSTSRLSIFNGAPSRGVAIGSTTLGPRGLPPKLLHLTPVRPGRKLVIAPARSIHKLKLDIVADAVNTAIKPALGSQVSWLALQSGLDLAGRAVEDVDAAAVRLPPRCAGLARYAGREPFIGKSDAPAVFFFELVSDGARRGIAAKPELFDELLTLLGSRDFQESGALPIGKISGVFSLRVSLEARP
jgi:hypothetical protein